MVKKFTNEDDELLAALGVKEEAKKYAARTPREERIIAGFEEIQSFVEKHNRVPLHGESRDIFERLYAVRLDRMREIEECRLLVEPLDHQDILGQSVTENACDVDDLDDEALLSELGVEVEAADISELRYVRSSAEKRAAEEIANRERCEDFEKFKPLFEQVKQELDQDIRISGVIRKDSGFLKTDIKRGEFFILGGQDFIHCRCRRGF